MSAPRLTLDRARIRLRVELGKGALLYDRKYTVDEYAKRSLAKSLWYFQAFLIAVHGPEEFVARPRATKRGKLRVAPSVYAYHKAALDAADGGRFYGGRYSAGTTRNHFTRAFGFAVREVLAEGDDLEKVVEAAIEKARDRCLAAP